MPPRPPVPVGTPILSSFVEAVADTQQVNTNADVIFGVAEVVGTDITFVAPGSNFVINTAGLYRVEWNANVDTSVVMGIVENGLLASATTHSGAAGNIASGSLINVVEGKVPYTISLRNFTENINITSRDNFENVAASIRISRIADGPKV